MYKTIKTVNGPVSKDKKRQQIYAGLATVSAFTTHPVEVEHQYSAACGPYDAAAGRQPAIRPPSTSHQPDTSQPSTSQQPATSQSLDSHQPLSPIDDADMCDCVSDADDADYTVNDDNNQKPSDATNSSIADIMSIIGNTLSSSAMSSDTVYNLIEEQLKAASRRDNRTHRWPVR